MKITKREAKYIHPAVVYRWEIYEGQFRKRALWDDDPILTVSVGSLAEQLIMKGILERVDWGMGITRIRLTKLGETFRCPCCYRGRTFHGSADPDKTIACPHCESGVRLDNGEE